MLGQFYPLGKFIYRHAERQARIVRSEIVRKLTLARNVGNGALYKKLAFEIHFRVFPHIFHDSNNT